MEEIRFKVDINEKELDILKQLVAFRYQSIKHIENNMEKKLSNNELSEEDIKEFEWFKKDYPKELEEYKNLLNKIITNKVLQINI